MKAIIVAARILLVTICLGCHSAWALSNARPLTAAPLAADVRVLIDVSGSMKINDPQNLRRPAVDLLVKLLPEESQAGIWSFGSDSQQLVAHQLVTDDWRRLAAEKAVTISSHALFTDIGAALEAAAGIAPSRDYRSNIILLTDGVVDIAKDAEVNQREWQRIVNELLPELRDKGFVIHTIALSENADQGLLQKLALATGGLAAVADEADELLPIFLKILDAAAPPEKAPLEDNAFEIDSTIEEFTALIFHELDGKAAKILDPAGDSLDFTENENLNWHRAENYDLATVKQPAAGKWQVLAELEPDSRVTVVSTLNLRLRDLPTNVYKGQAIPVSFALRKDDAIVTAVDLLSDVNFELELQRNTGAGFEPVWNNTLASDQPPESGIFNVQLPKFGDTGDYRLLVRATGDTIQRELTHHFSVRMPFDAEILAEQGAAGDVKYLLLLRSNSPDIQSDKTQVVATILSPENRRLVRPMALTDTENWELPLKPQTTGRYQVTVTVTGVDKAGTEFGFKLEDLGFYYSPERGFIKEMGETPPAVVELPEPEIATEPAPVVEEELAPAPESPPEPESEVKAAPASMPSALLYTALALGNLLLVGLIVWGYRRLVSKERDPEDILAEYSETSIAASGESPGGEGAGTSDVGEPEMGVHRGPADPSAEDVEDLLAASADAVDEASLDEALASLLGELDAENDAERATDAGGDAGLDLDEKPDDGPNRR